MKVLFFSLFSFFFLKSAYGQVTGKFSTENGQPVSFATVLLLKSADSSLVKGSITEETGIFKIDSISGGNYLLRFSSVGYQTWNSPVFELKSIEKSKDFGNQIVTEDAQQLGEVTIKTQKPLFQQEIDRTVINVESSVMSKGSSALQILERSPGVYVDQRNSNISLGGKSSVMIMLNGKVMRLPISQVVAMLNSMSANDIEKIELITTPPAKYDAEGTGGMINIVLKKREEAGTTGSISATGGYGWGEKGTGSASLSHNAGKISLYGSYSFMHDRLRDGWAAKSTQDMPAFGGKLNVDVSSTQKVVSNNHNAAAGIDVNLGNSKIGGSFTYNASHVSRDILNLGNYTIIESDSLLVMHAKINSETRLRNMIGNIYLEKQIREGEKLNIDLDYLDYKNESPTEGHTLFFDGKGNEALPNSSIFSNRQKGVSTTPIHVGVLKMDYAKQFSPKLKLEAGVKGTLTRSSGLSRIANLIDGEWVTTSRYTNNIAMKENISAGYSSLQFQANPTMSLSAGLRYEYSHTYADADKEENRIDRRLGKLFPSLFMSKKFNERSEIQFSYTKRVSRPSFNDLSSYLLYNDPMSVSTGNPSLRPTITNNLKLGYNYKSFSFSVLASRDKNPIVLYQQKESPAHDLMYLAPQNMAYQNNLIFQASLPCSITNWWNMTYSATGGWRKFKLDHTEEKLVKTYVAYNFNGSQTFTLPQNFTFEISGWYNSGTYEGSKRIDGFGMLNAGLKKELKNNKGSFQFTVSDLLKSMRVPGHFGRLTEEAFSLKADFVYKAESANDRIFKLTYSRSFGNIKVKGQNSRSSVSKDESDRIRKN